MLGVGDDAAILRSSGREILFCSDMMIENIHFDFKFSTPADVGYKAIARSLSDVAAMGGTPLGITISISIPKAWSAEKCETFLFGFYQGACEISREFKSPIVGGDLSRSSSHLFIDIAAVGQSRATNATWRRSGARAGDLAFVTGELGRAAFALGEFKSGRTPEYGVALKHLRPRPRFDVGEMLPADAVHAAIDISDGFVRDALHLCQASSVSLELTDQNFSDFELFGGDDYELLLAIPPEVVRPSVIETILATLGAIAVGVFTQNAARTSEVRLRSRPLKPLGHDSFRDDAIQKFK